MGNDVVLSAGVRQNLLALQNTALLMATTQTRLATGKKVNSALDNPVNFFTSAGLSSRAKDLRQGLGYGGNKGAAAKVGKLLGEKALAKGIQQAAFDRNGYKFHGRVKALADAAREAGLKF